MMALLWSLVYLLIFFLLICSSAGAWSIDA
jgi:hypothetical protein